MAGDVKPPKSVEAAIDIIRDFLARAFVDSDEDVLSQVHVTSVGGWACKVMVESKARKHGFAIPPRPEYADMIFEAGEKVSRLATKWGATWKFPEDAIGKKKKGLIIQAIEPLSKDLRLPRKW